MSERKKSTPPKRPSRKAIRRTVVSSTAIETGEPIHVIEKKLKRGVRRFKDVQLANG